MVAARNRLIFVELDRRESFLQLSQEPRPGRRIDLPHEQADALALGGDHPGTQVVDERIKLRRLDLLAIRPDSADPLGVVEIEDRRGGEGISTAIAQRVQRVALQVGGSSLVHGRHQRDTAVRSRHRRRVEKRLAGNDPLDVLAVRQDVFLRPAAPRQPQPGGRCAGTHQFHEATPGIAYLRLAELPGTLGKLALEMRLEGLLLLELGERAPVTPARHGLVRVLQDALHREKLKRSGFSYSTFKIQR